MQNLKNVVLGQKVCRLLQEAQFINPPQFGGPPLIIAACKNKLEMVQALITVARRRLTPQQFDLFMSTKNWNKKTVMDVAKDNKVRPEIVKAIRWAIEWNKLRIEQAKGLPLWHIIRFNKITENLIGGLADVMEVEACQ